jgi:hypothetical protein
MQKNLVKILICLAATFSLSGCNTAVDPRWVIARTVDSHDPAYKEFQKKYETLNSSPSPFQLQGLSVARPVGRNWNLFPFELPTSNSICFVKNFPEQNHSGFANVDVRPQTRTFSNVESYIKWHQEALFIGTNSQNLLLNSSIEPDKKYGEFCIKYFKDVETHEKRMFSQKIWQHQEWGYYFLLPSQPHKEVCVSYFEWGLPADVATNLPNEAEAFLNGVKIK